MSTLIPVWLITGCSSGFGLDIARTVLSHGHRVIATSRCPSRTPDLVNEITSQGGHWLELDITSPETLIAQTIREAHAIHGRIDYIVNNAGFGPVAGFEDFSDSAVRAVFDTNVFGTIKVTKAVLPFMREQRSGCIINMSSRSGFEGMPGFSVYAAGKFAMEGWSESLSREYAGFRVRVLLVEPGLFRTGFSSSSDESTRMSDFYSGTPVADMLERLEKVKGKESGDPKKAAERIWEVAVGEGLGKGLEGYLRVVLGGSAQKAAVEKAEKMRENFVACGEIAGSADF